MIAALVFCSIFGTLHPELYARENRMKFEHVTVEEGLSQSTVNCIFQDSRGLMWFGTEDGLNKYNGYNFTIYRNISDNQSSLSNNWIYTVIEDRQNNLWIGTRAGLNRFDRRTETFIRYSDEQGFSGIQARALCEDFKGNIWIGTQEGGLNRYNSQTDRFEVYKHNPDDLNSIASNSIRSLYSDRSGNLWIGTADVGVDRYDHERDIFLHYPRIPGSSASIFSKPVTVIKEDTKGYLWIGTQDGLVQWSPERNETTYLRYNGNGKDNAYSLSNNAITSLFFRSSNELLIGTENGLDILNLNDRTLEHHYSRSEDISSLNNNIIKSIYEDPFGVLWIGTEGGGLNKFASQMIRFQHYQSYLFDTPESLKGKLVFSFCEDREGMIWIGTNRGLNRFDRKTGTFTLYPLDTSKLGRISDKYVSIILQDRTGMMWLGTWGGGLIRFDRKSGKFSSFRVKPNDTGNTSVNIVVSIREDKNGALWIGTYGGGLHAFNREKEVFRHYPCSATPSDRYTLKGTIVYYIHENRDGVSWIGTESGLNRFDPRTGIFSYYTENPHPGGPDSKYLSTNLVGYIHESANEILWIGTPCGLNKFDPKTGRFTHYRLKDGLPNEMINAILEDDHGNLWLSTNFGLSKFNPQNSTFKNYQLKDGLQNSEFNRGACLKSRSGEMFFGGLNGFNRFFPDRIRDNSFIPPVIITDLKIFDRSSVVWEWGKFKKEIHQLKHLALSYQDYMFTIEFAALDYSHPSANRYMYKLEGFDKRWIDSGNRRFTSYTAVPPGQYLFKVKGSNSDGVWNEQGASIYISIVPPFYQTPIARVFIAVGIFSLVFLLYRFRIRSIRKRAGELEEINRRLNRNITDRMAAETQVQKSERRLRTFLDTASEGFLEVDIQQVIMDLNPEMCSILGRRREEIIDHSIYNFVAPWDAEVLHRQIALRKEGKRSSYNLTMLRPDHSSVHCLLNASPLYDDKGNIKGAFALVTNITDFVKAEEEIKHTKNYLDSVFNSLSSILITVNREGIITQWNKAAEKFFKVPIQKAISKELEKLVPFMKQYRDNMKTVVITRKPLELHRESVPGGKKENEKLFMDIVVYPLVYSSEDEIEGLVIRLEDVTELERKDRQLIQAQKMETVGNLAGGLAHDFNNVLGGIVGTTSLIKYMMEKEDIIDQDTLKNRIEIIEKGAGRAVDLVRQLLTLSRKMEPTFAPVNLNHSIKYVMKICENTFDKSIKIIANYCDTPPLVLADHTQMEQVLLNLCVNASHAMTLMRKKDGIQGGILTLSIREFWADRRFSATHPGSVEQKYWLIAVEDTGVGMDSKIISKIFDPFFTTKAEGHGTGLGLAMVYNIVQKHKGFIDVYSQVDVGSTFKVFLPQLEDQYASVDNIAAWEEPVRGSGLIMVVDDEEQLRTMSSELLETCGYKVITAVDGQEGVNIYKEKQNEITAILLDMAMPNMSGKEAYIEIKKTNPHVKVLLTSGFRLDQRVKEVLQLGVKGFIQKPFSLVELSKKIAEVIEQS